MWCYSTSSAGSTPRASASFLTVVMCGSVQFFLMRFTVLGRFFSSLSDTQEARQFEPREFVAQDDRVVALGSMPSPHEEGP
jgi:hypothetical protein